MVQGKSRDPKRERLWRRHLRRQWASGLTVRDYCAEHELWETTFHFWRRDMAARDQERSVTSASTAQAEPEFVPSGVGR